MTQISVNGSSWVAKQCGPSRASEWDACVQAVNDYYRPADTFATRFEQHLRDVKALGYTALDIWTAGQLNWQWATDEQLRTARALLDKHGITVTSLGNAFGETRDEFVAACQLAVAVKTRLLSGGCPVFRTERAFVIEMLDKYDLLLGLENHPERSAQEMLDQIRDDGHGRVGATVDTGWFATQAPDVVKAIEELGKHIFHIHLKDVARGGPDLNVGLGKGIVPLEACVRALQRTGYTGDYSVEIHSLDHDPTQELREGLLLVRAWLSQ